MTHIENLHYAIGELAYTIARADGNVQKEERKKFHDIVESELQDEHIAFDVSDIIFQIMDKDKTDSGTSYKWAMNEIKLNSHYLSPELKIKFINILEKVAQAFPPVTKKEQAIIDEFKKDIAGINGDPVYYEKTL